MDPHPEREGIPTIASNTGRSNPRNRSEGNRCRRSTNGTHVHAIDARQTCRSRSGQEGREIVDPSTGVREVDERDVGGGRETRWHGSPAFILPPPARQEEQGGRRDGFEARGCGSFPEEWKTGIHPSIGHVPRCHTVWSGSGLGRGVERPGARPNDSGWRTGIRSLSGGPTRARYPRRSIPPRSRPPSIGWVRVGLNGTGKRERPEGDLSRKGGGREGVLFLCDTWRSCPDDVGTRPKVHPIHLVPGA